MARAGAEAWRPVLALIGLRCSGKTGVGRALAPLLGAPFVDLDQALVELARGDGRGEASAGALLAALGEPEFRELEARALARALAAQAPLVLATGGGAPEREANRAALAERALCVLLDAPDAVLAERLARTRTARPPLAAEDELGEVRRLRELRAPLFARLAACTLDSSQFDAERLAADLASRLEFDRALGFRLLR